MYLPTYRNQGKPPQGGFFFGNYIDNSMEGFKQFFTEMTEREKDVRDTLKKVPKSHSKFVQGYAFKWQAGNTLKGDDDHIGIINPMRRTVTIAAPWNYGREFTFLHELAHKVWENLVDEKMRNEWVALVKRTKHKMQQNAEELFCMAYANHYAKNKIEIHNHPEWEKFIKKLPK